MGKLRGAMHKGNGASSLSQRKSCTGHAIKKRQPNINRSSSARKDSRICLLDRYHNRLRAT
jgi:hypothetical protein